MSQPDCEMACASEMPSSSMLCVSSLEENDAIFAAFVEAGKCENNVHDSCVWLGLTNSVSNNHDAHGMRYHWDKWSNGCGSRYRDWDRSQPNGGIGYYDYEDQNCVVMGFFKRPQWWDVNCTSYRSKCVCEVQGDYDTPPGGCISFLGVCALLLTAGGLCATGGYLYAKPEQAAALRAKLTGRFGGLFGQRARTGTATTGLAASDHASTNYVVPALPAA